MRSNNAELNRLDEIMSQNIQLSNEQNVNSLYTWKTKLRKNVQYTIILQMNLRGNSRGNLHESKGDYLDRLSHNQKNPTNP
jgi:hypothetical protein